MKYFSVMASTQTKQQFYIRHQNKKFQMPSYQSLLKNIIPKLLMRGERRRNIQLCFTNLPSITDRKEEVNQHRNNVNLSPVDSRMLKSLAGCLTEFSASDFYWIFFSFRLFFYILTSLSISRVFSSGFLGRPKSFCLDIPRTIIKCDYLN